MAHLYRKEQGQYWEMEVPDDKIISIHPDSSSTIEVRFMSGGEKKYVKCDKIGFV